MSGQTCPHCDYTRMPMEGSGSSCPRCGELYATPPKPRPKTVAPQIPTDPVEKAWYFRDFRDLSAEQLGQAASRVDICTLEFMPGREIDCALGLVSGSYTVAFGAIFEAVAGLARNIRGTGSSPQTEQHIRIGIRQVIGQLRVEAITAFGADAVVGIRYHFEEFSGANNQGILVVVGTGTAVRYKSAADPSPSGA